MNIESLAEEGRKIHSTNVMANIARNAGDEGVHNRCINALLQPTTWQPDANPNEFLLSAAEALITCYYILLHFSTKKRWVFWAVLSSWQVSRLCDMTLEVLKSQEMVLSFGPPSRLLQSSLFHCSEGLWGHPWAVLGPHAPLCKVQSTFRWRGGDIAVSSVLFHDLSQ